MFEYNIDVIVTMQAGYMNDICADIRYPKLGHFWLGLPSLKK